MASINTIASMIGMMKAVYPHYLKDADVKPTATAWAGLFQDVPDTQFIAAFKASLGKCTFPPTPADVTAEIKYTLNRNVNSSTEWDLLMETCEKVNSLRSEFNYTYIPDGSTISQGAQARKDARNAYYELPMCLQDFLGSPSAMLQYAKEMESMDGTGLQIRRRDYEKWRKDAVAESDIAELTAAMEQAALPEFNEV